MTGASIAVIFLVMVAVGGVAYVLIYPHLSGDSRGERRQKEIVVVDAGKRRTERATAVNRREAVAQSLKELDKQNRSNKRVSLEARIAFAGLTWSKTRYFITCAVIGVIVAVAASIPLRNLIMGSVVGFAAGAGLPLWYLAFLKSRRIKKFQDEFPNAIDIIVRGVKSGLPLGDCLRIISVEAAEPVRSEFRRIIEAQSIGMSIGEACGKLYRNMPTPEANFFGIVVQIQSKTGGSLSDAFGNLSRVLRERKKMKGKIDALSMEAKASAAIIAALPFIVSSMLTMINPRYMLILFTTQTGKLLIAGSLFWMFIGIMSMRKMIRFDF